MAGPIIRVSVRLIQAAERHDQLFGHTSEVDAVAGDLRTQLIRLADAETRLAMRQTRVAAAFIRLATRSIRVAPPLTRLAPFGAFLL